MSVSLYNEDCLKALKQLVSSGVRVDMILTDPPYGMQFQSNRRKNQYDKIIGDGGLSWLDDFVSLSFDICKDNTAHYVFCSFHNIDIFKQAFQKKFTVKNILVWEKNNTGMGDLKGDFAPKLEFILLLHKGRSLIRGKRDPNILKFSRTGNKLHPTQKPVDLCKYLIEKFSDKGNLILDPFAGSGSTGVAAEECERNFIGIELNTGYFNIMKERLYHG